MKKEAQVNLWYTNWRPTSEEVRDLRVRSHVTEVGRKTTVVGLLEAKAVANISLRCVLKDQKNKWAPTPLPLSTCYILSIMDIQINVSFAFFPPHLYNYQD